MFSIACLLFCLEKHHNNLGKVRTSIYLNDKGEGNFRFWAENYDEAGMEH